MVLQKSQEKVSFSIEIYNIGPFSQLLNFWFNFRFALYIPLRRTRRNEKRAWYKPSTKRLPPTFFDWLTFAESANQNYFRFLFF